MLIQISAIGPISNNPMIRVTTSLSLAQTVIGPEISRMRNVHIVLLTKTVLNWIKFNSSKQNFNFSKYIPRERGGLPVRADLAPAPKAYSPRTRGSSRLQTLIWQFHSIFPANAGVNLRWRVRVQVCEHFPAYAGVNPHLCCFI